MEKPNFDNLLALIGGDREFLIELLQTFISSTEKAIMQFKHDMEQNNWKSISDCAHQIAPSLQQMGATESYALTKEIEQKTKDNHLIDNLKLTQLIHQLEQLNELIKRYIQ